MNELTSTNQPASVALDPALAAAPAIWNPNVGANWSLLFSPAFGAFIHARNAETLGRLEEAKANWKWFYGTLAFLAATLVFAAVPALEHLPLRLLGIVVLLAWYFSVAAKQVQFVKESYGKTYPKKTWGQPLLIAFACLIGFFIVAFVIGLAIGIMRGLAGHA